MKKFAIFLLILLCVTNLFGCGAKQVNEEQEQPTVAVTEADVPENVETSTAEVSNESELAWPEEYSKWGVPQLEVGTVIFSDNRSGAGQTMTKGILATVNIGGITSEDFADYDKALATAGFIKSTDSLGEALSFYEKTVDGGLIKITTSFSDNTATIVAENTAAAAEKPTSDGKTSVWPKTIKEIPAFTDGDYLETIELGGNMFAMTFLNVTDKALDAYRKTLLDAGFEKQDGDDEGYAKLGESAAYSIGLILDGTTLQIIAAYGTY